MAKMSWNVCTDYNDFLQLLKLLQLLEHLNICIDCFLYKMVIIDIKFIMAMIVVIVILAAMVVT